MIINVRGTSGSGKTFAVRQALHQMQDFQTISMDGKRKAIANVAYYKLNPVFVLGDYTQNECGGCDTIRTQDEVCSLVRHFSQFGHVIFEGLLISGLFARYASLCEEFQEYNEPYVWAFMDTPLEVCLERVKARREARGDNCPFNPDNTISKHKAVVRRIDDATKAGYWVEMLNHNGNPGFEILKLLDVDIYEFKVIKESFR